MNTQVNKIKAELQQFIGSETFYKIPLIGTRFTDGIKYLADTAECFWLVTDASVIAKSLMNKSYFVTVDFKRLSEKERAEKQCEALINYSDGNGNIYETHRYHVTDFPLDELRLFFVDNTLMLPSEYWFSIMVYLNYSNLDKETQERLVSVSKKDVEQKFGNELKRYAKEHHIEYDTLLEEEALRNLYSYDYVFNI